VDNGSVWLSDGPSFANQKCSSLTNLYPTLMRSCGCKHVPKSANCINDLQTTFIYVTHDQVEAMTMATRIAVLNKGLLAAIRYTPTAL
jgi:hypothetical protein